MVNEILENCEGFEWDDANEEKNRHKHKVAKVECEQVFFNRPLVIEYDVRRSLSEIRFYVLVSFNQNDDQQRQNILFRLEIPLSNKVETTI